MDAKTQEKTKSPQWFLTKAVAVPILLGTVLLMVPLASRSGQWTDPLTALFMATSAMCVTGLVLRRAKQADDTQKTIVSPNADNIIELGDTMVIFCTDEKLHKLEKELREGSMQVD